MIILVSSMVLFLSCTKSDEKSVNNDEQEMTGSKSGLINIIIETNSTDSE